MCSLTHTDLKRIAVRRYHNYTLRIIKMCILVSLELRKGDYIEYLTDRVEKM